MIKLDLTIDEVNTILRSLGQHPFAEIANLIGKIKSQGDPQVAEMEKQLAATQAAAGETPAAPAA